MLNNEHDRLYTLLLLGWVAVALIGLSAGILFACLLCLSIIVASIYPYPHDALAHFFFGGGWLLVPFGLYLISGVAFTRFAARRIRCAFASEELPVQRRTAYLCGLPFYVLCLFCFMTSMLAKVAMNASVFGPLSHFLHTLIFVIFAKEVTDASAFGGLGGIFGLVSVNYLMLMRYFLRPSAALARQ